MILDEISQASGETVSQVSYMLINGQGKDRLRADASRRKTHTWLLNFLSTGELTINDKIQWDGKHSAMAGQEVRVIDLPIGGHETQTAFQDLHGLDGGGKFSELLSRNASRYYGSPLRAFLTALGADMENNIARVELEMKAFVAEHCPAGASGQVRRVARKFALTAAAGELGLAFGVLPFEPGASRKAAAVWFKIWLEGREGYGDLEVIKAVKRIQDHLAVNSSRYIDRDSSTSYIPHNHEGYVWRKDGKLHYHMLTPIFNNLARGANRKTLLKELECRKYLAYNSKGKLKDTLSVNGETKRGWVFIPSAWEGEPTPEEVEEELQRARCNTIETLFE